MLIIRRKYTDKKINHENHFCFFNKNHDFFLFLMLIQNFLHFHFDFINSSRSDFYFFVK